MSGLLRVAVAVGACAVAAPVAVPTRTAAASPAGARVVERVSVSTAGAQGNRSSGWGLQCHTDCVDGVPPVMSADGRLVTFVSDASTLVPADSNGTADVFVHDRQTGSTERVSVSSAGRQADGASGLFGVAISATGRYVAFESDAANLVAGDTNGLDDIYVHDRLTGRTVRASVTSAGGQADGSSVQPSISADGRYVAFTSGAPNLLPAGTIRHTWIFVHDLVTGRTRSLPPPPGATECGSEPAISADGRQVTWVCDNSDTAMEGVWVTDLATGTSRLASTAHEGPAGYGSVFDDQPAISADGRWVAYVSTNFYTNRTSVFVRDMVSGRTERASVSGCRNPGSVAGNYASIGPSISGNGRFVAFWSYASNLVAGDTNHAADVFVRDLRAKRTWRVSVSAAGRQANAESHQVALAADGRWVSYASSASNLVPDDTNGVPDVFTTSVPRGPAAAPPDC